MRKNHSIRYQIQLVAFFLFLVVSPSIQVVGQSSPIEIKSVYRTMKISLVEDIKPKDPNEVLLIIRLEGITVEQAQVNRKETYLMADTLRCDLDILETSGKRTSYPGTDREKVYEPYIMMLFAVPRDALEMNLFVGELPPAPFRAPEEISEELKSWEIE